MVGEIDLQEKQDSVRSTMSLDIPSMTLAPKVLVIDDEPDVRLYLRTLLEANGFLVMEAADADEALEVVKASSPDAIILDIIMPGPSGVILFNKIRQMGHLKRVPVIVLSGVHDKFIEDFRVFFNALKLHKPIAFLDKPVDPQALITALLKALDLGTYEESYP